MSSDGGPLSALPSGLYICETCREPRGTTDEGLVSACYCSGVICERCGGRRRRPISDYYSLEAECWAHVPYFALMGHRCPPNAEVDGPRRWKILKPDADVRTCQETSTQLAWAEVAGKVAPFDACSVRVVEGRGIAYVLRPSGKVDRLVAGQGPLRRSVANEPHG